MYIGSLNNLNDQKNREKVWEYQSPDIRHALCPLLASNQYMYSEPFRDHSKNTVLVTRKKIKMASGVGLTGGLSRCYLRFEDFASCMVFFLKRFLFTISQNSRLFRKMLRDLFPNAMR